MDKTSLDIEFENAVRLLVEHMPPSEEGSRKPILFHDIRVGTHLYRKGYSRNIVLAGVLHDAIEWSDITEELLRDGFEENILRIVLANSKDRSIKDSDKRIDDMIERCVAEGEGALIVKAADTIDSFEYYTKTGNKKELSGHCMKTTEAIFQHLPADFHDPIFEELRKWKDKTI